MIRATAALLFAAAASAATAASITFCNVCAGYHLVHLVGPGNASSLVVECPATVNGKPGFVPWLTIPNCAHPSATTQGGAVTLTC